MPLWRMNRPCSKELNKQEEDAPAQKMHAEASVQTTQKESKRQRSEVLKLRLTPEEYAYLSEQAERAGISRTDYIMRLARGNSVIVMETAPILLELKRQGTNLNQIVRLCNQYHDTRVSGVYDAIRLCTRAQSEVVRFCQKWDVVLRKCGGEAEFGDCND